MQRFYKRGHELVFFLDSVFFLSSRARRSSTVPHLQSFAETPDHKHGTRLEDDIWNVLNEMIALITGNNPNIMVDPEHILVLPGGHDRLSHETKTVKIPSRLTSTQLNQIAGGPYVKLNLLSRLCSDGEPKCYHFYRVSALEQGRWETSIGPAKQKMNKSGTWPEVGRHGLAFCV